MFGAEDWVEDRHRPRGVARRQSSLPFRFPNLPKKTILNVPAEAYVRMSPNMPCIKKGLLGQQGIGPLISSR